MIKDGKAGQGRKVKTAPVALPEKPGLETRSAASKLLAAVLDRHTSLDGMLDPVGGNPAYRALSEPDRALLRAILTTALRHLPRIDAAIDMLIDKPLPEGAKALYHVLTVAAAQIFYLDIPDHSAVDLAVEQANRDPRSRRFASLVNAVLRRMSREKVRLLAETADIPVLPAWYMRRLEADYGLETAKAIAVANQQPSAIDLTVKSDPARWAETIGGVVLPNGSVRLTEAEGAISELPGFAEGAWFVQDSAASLPARLFGSVEGLSVVDLCAAPGGKTAQLLLAGAKVTALDQSATRLKRLAGNLERLGLEAAMIETNMLDFKPERKFDAALLDAPCSSTGTTRRHPDVLYTKGPEDIAKLAALQEKMLRHTAEIVRPGGLVVFSNCSLDQEEGEKLVERVLASDDRFERVAVQAEQLPGLESAVSALGEVRTHPALWPHEDPALAGLDGFFASVLRVLR